MTIRKIIRLISIMLIMSATAGCTPKEKKSSSSEVRRDLEGLHTLINIPATASQVWWKTIEPPLSRVPGPSDWQLLAVLQMTPDSIATITKKSRLISGQTYQFESDQEIKNFLAPHGRPSIEGHDASFFYKSPLLEGFFLTIGRDKIFVYLSTH